MTDVRLARAALCGVMAALLWLSSGVPGARAQDAWTTPYPAHRVIGPLHAVGTAGLGVFLIVSDEGHILINTGLEDSLPLIRDNIESVGYALDDVRILLTMQSHFDHTAALAEIKALTGAEMWATGDDARVLEDGGLSDPHFGGSVSFPPISVDRIIRDGEVIELGDIRLTVHEHPGHTEGSSSYSMVVTEAGREYDVVVANMGTINDGKRLFVDPTYPGVGEDFAETYRKQKAMDVDVWVAAHGNQYGLEDKHEPGQPYSPDTFVDPDGFRAEVERLERLYLEQVERERREAAIDAETGRLNEWLDARFEEALDFSPMEKTSIGRKDDYDRIDQMSEAAGDQEFEWLASTVDELEDSFDYDLLDAEAKTSYDLWIYRYERMAAGRPFRRRAYLFNQMRGVHNSLPQFMITQHGVETESDMRAYISRLEEAARAIDQMLERARIAADEGVHAPRFAYEAVITSSRALIGGRPFERNADTSAPLWDDASRKVDALLEREVIDEATAGELRARAQSALVDRLEPAYEALIAWAESELPLTDEIATGVWKLPDGEAFYDNQLASITTTAMTAGEIHDLGLAEVERIHGEMKAIRERVGFEGSLQEFFVFVRDDPRFFYPNTDEGRQAYLDAATGHIDSIEARLPDYFGILPKAPLEVRRVEAFRERPGQAAHYQRGAPDGSRPGIYYSHLIDMTATPIPDLESTAYHEGLPGHHMQISIAQEAAGLPLFRTLSGYTAYIEGWGLYAEWLAKEMGGYEDPYSDFGRLAAEVWRAIRLVVDTGLHAKGWTQEEAVQYALENSPNAEGKVRAEVERYLVMPGQATAYKIGMLKFQALRARAEAALGDRFDIRAFHDTVLGGGALPLTVLERRVDNWISAKNGADSGPLADP